MSAPRLLHLVRHGETSGESSVRLWGRTDVPLSDLGRQQVRALAAVLRPLPVALVVHSPLCRAVETAEILLEQLGHDAVPRIVEEGFAEIDFGQFEGLTREEIAARDPRWFASWEQGAHEGYPDGERLALFDARVREALARIEAATSGDILVVAHRGVIRRIANAVVPAAGDGPTDLASVSTLDLDARRVVRWNVLGTGMR